MVPQGEFCLLLTPLIAVVATLYACDRPPSEASTPAIPRKLFNSDDLNFQFIRTAGAAPYAADVAECVETARRIKDESVESWYREWYALAERVAALGASYQEAGNAPLAREALVRASNYYRNAGFFLSEKPLDPSLRDIWEKSVGAFRRAAGLFSPPIERVEIPYQGTILPAYFYPSLTAGSAPTLIVHQGFDGSKEESIGWGLVAQQRGYNCLIFEGPGQGELIHDRGVPFTAEWEQVIKPVVDFLSKRPEVDPTRIALLGLSMGGYLAPRAATGEPRLAAVIANGGVYSVFEGLAAKWVGIDLHGQSFASPAELLQFIKSYPQYFDGMMESLSAQRLGLKWSMVHGMYTFGVASPSDYYLKTAQMTLEGIAQQIACPTLVIDSENDTSFPGQPQKLYENIAAPKQFLMFTAVEGADLHCQAGAFEVSSGKTLDWLDSVLRH